MVSKLNNIKIECLENISDFLEIKSEWNALVSRCHTDRLFISHEWFEAVSKWLDDKSAPYIVLIYKNNELIGICPLMRYYCQKWFIHYQALGYLMIPASPYTSIISSDEDTHIALDTLTEYLYAHQHQWHIMNIRNMHIQIELDHYSTLSKNFNAESIYSGSDAIVNLKANWGHYYATRSRHLKRNNNNVRNRLGKAGSITVEHIDRHNIDTYQHEDILEQITSIAANSWKTGTRNDLSSSRARAYLEFLLTNNTLKDSLSLWILKLDGLPIAYELQLIENNNVFALHAEFHNGYEHLSPGSHLNFVIIQQLFASGFEKYHMGSGRGGYKLNLANEEACLYSLKITSKSFKGIVLHCLDPA